MEIAEGCLHKHGRNGFRLLGGAYDIIQFHLTFCTRLEGREIKL